MIYRVHSQRVLNKLGKILGYISICQGKTSTARIYKVLVQSKIIQEGWCDLACMTRVPYPTNGTYDEGTLSYSILANGRERFYLYPIIEKEPIQDDLSIKNYTGDFDKLFHRNNWPNDTHTTSKNWFVDYTNYQITDGANPIIPVIP